MKEQQQYIDIINFFIKNCIYQETYEKSTRRFWLRSDFSNPSGPSGPNIELMPFENDLLMAFLALFEKASPVTKTDKPFKIYCTARLGEEIEIIERTICSSVIIDPDNLEETYLAFVDHITHGIHRPRRGRRPTESIQAISLICIFMREDSY